VLSINQSEYTETSHIKFRSRGITQKKEYSHILFYFIHYLLLMVWQHSYYLITFMIPEEGNHTSHVGFYINKCPLNSVHFWSLHCIIIVYTITVCYKINLHIQIYLTSFLKTVFCLCASSPLCDIQSVWQYMCVALTVKHNYFIG